MFFVVCCQILYPSTLQSEYIADFEKRREYISNFTGSAGMQPFPLPFPHHSSQLLNYSFLGTAVVTQNEALLWTDGRYWLQASTQLDSNWKLMKDRVPNAPSVEEYLSKVSFKLWANTCCASCASRVHVVCMCLCVHARCVFVFVDGCGWVDVCMVWVRVRVCVRAHMPF